MVVVEHVFLSVFVFLFFSILSAVVEQFFLNFSQICLLYVWLPDRSPELFKCLRWVTIANENKGLKPPSVKCCYCSFLIVIAFSFQSFCLFLSLYFATYYKARCHQFDILGIFTNESVI